MSSRPDPPDLQTELDLRRAENATLKRQLAAQKKKNDAVLASSSWRVTAPLRAVGSWLKRFGLGTNRSAEAPDSISLEQYQCWLRACGTIDRRTHDAMAASIAMFSSRPLISVIMPVYNIESTWLREAIRSVREQIYPHLELCVSDDASTLGGVRDVLSEQAAQDPRIRLNFRNTNGHISANSNSALELATGDYIALLDADDLLSPDALYWVAHAIAAHPDTDLLFSDEDKIGEDGERFDPYFKSAWNPALMLSQNAFSHLGVFRRSLVTQVGGFREAFDGSQDHDLVLRCAERTRPERIRHIPRILYHWRTLPGSASASIDSKPYAWHAGKRAIEGHLERTGTAGSVELALSSYYRVSYEPPAPPPRVSIIATRSSVDIACLRSILNKTAYGDVEISVSPHDHERSPGDPRTPPDTREPPQQAPFINRAVDDSRGSVVCLFDDRLQPMSAEWLEHLVSRAMLDGVGIAAPMIVDVAGNILHAGIVPGPERIDGLPFRGYDAASAGYFGRAGLEQDYTCVSSACMVMRRDVFQRAGGFDAALPAPFDALDFCLRVRHAGLRILWVPAVQLRQEESDTPAPAYPAAANLLRERWSGAINDDPCYNPNLSVRGDRLFELSMPPRLTLSRGLSPEALLAMNASRAGTI